MSKYAPTNDEGEKPYVVVQSGWGRKVAKVVYANTAADAKYRAFGRQGVGERVSDVRRATPADVALSMERPYSSLHPDDFAAANALIVGKDET